MHKTCRKVSIEEFQAIPDVLWKSWGCWKLREWFKIQLKNSISTTAKYINLLQPIYIKIRIQRSKQKVRNPEIDYNYLDPTTSSLYCKYWDGVIVWTLGPLWLIATLTYSQTPGLGRIASAIESANTNASYIRKTTQKKMVRIQKHIPEKPKGSNFDHSNCDFQWPTGIFSVLFKKYKLYNLIKKNLYILNNNNNK